MVLATALGLPAFACRSVVKRAIVPSLALLGATLDWTSAQAQSAPDECASSPNDAAEIECLRKALAATRQALGERDAATAPAPPPVSPSAPVAAAAPRPTVPRSANPQPRELGAEQVASKAAEPAGDRAADRVQSAIAEFRRDRRGLLVMKLENGQIWRQVEDVGLPVNLDEGGRTPVEIAESGFGGYRMYFSETGRRLAVSRIQ